MSADYTTYCAKFRKDGVVLQNAAQAKQAFIKLVYNRGYITEEREGKLIISRIGNFGTPYWPNTQVEISEEADCIIFDFNISAFNLVLQGATKKLKFYIDRDVMPEWSLLRVE
jgi:hypothetical protein